MKSISKCLTAQTVGINVDVREVGQDDVTTVGKMDIVAIKMAADLALKKWPKFSRNDF